MAQTIYLDGVEVEIWQDLTEFAAVFGGKPVQGIQVYIKDAGENKVPIITEIWKNLSDLQTLTSLQLYKEKANSPTTTRPVEDNDVHIGQGDMLKLLASGSVLFNKGVKINAGFGLNNGLSFGDGDTGLFESMDDELRFSLAGDDKWRITGTRLGSRLAGQPVLFGEVGSDTNPNIIPNASFSGTGISSEGANILNLITNSLTRLKIGLSGDSTFSGSLALPIRSETSSTTFGVLDHTIVATGAGSFDFTLPTAVGIKGRTYIGKRLGAGTTNLIPDGTETIDGNAGALNIPTGDAIRLQSDNVNWIII